MRSPQFKVGLGGLQRCASKYGAEKTLLDGITFDSKWEAQGYASLKLRQRAGEVLYFLMQVPFRLPGGVTYRVDFMVVHADGRIDYLDYKGYETAIFKLKKKQVEALYPVKIECVSRPRGRLKGL